MIRVEEAEQKVLQYIKDVGEELLPFGQCLHRILAAPITADRDLPPFNRVTMDGIAIRYSCFEAGTRSFAIKGIQAAGQSSLPVDAPGQCIEIMTGAALHETADTVICYEDLELRDGMAIVRNEQVRKGQNIHRKGIDKKQGDVLAPAGTIVDAAITGIAASVGAAFLRVKKWPSVVIISTGDELVGVQQNPEPAQIRRSNDHTIAAVLQQHGISAVSLHIPDQPDTMKTVLECGLHQFDVVLLTGGVSMGKFDHVPEQLLGLSVDRVFHQVRQRPGKPFWFGHHPKGTLVFAFPGNPVSTFMCLHRYFLPWLFASCGCSSQPVYAQLAQDVAFDAPLQYFMQVRLHSDPSGRLLATPITGNGSGDFASLALADAFMELPLEQNNFTAGTAFRIWPFKKISMYA